MADLPDYPLIPDSDAGDLDCCGSIVPWNQGVTSDLVCNECGLYFSTLPSAHVAFALAKLAPADEVTSADCPHCGMHNVFPHFAAMLAFTCRHCGRAVQVSPPAA